MHTFFHLEPAAGIDCAYMLSLPLKKKSGGIESHGSVALTDLSPFFWECESIFLPTWIRDWTLLTGLLPLHAFWPILVLLSSFFARLPQMLADI